MAVLGIFTFLVALSIVTPACDKGWALFKGECLYFGHTPMTWLDAEADCRKHHSYLATDDNEEKHNFIAKFLNVFTSWGLRHFWLGASDYTVENRWQWLETGGIVSGFTAWLPGQPGGNLSQNCMATTMNGTNMYWDDLRCDNSHHSTKEAYVCEKPDPDFQSGGGIVIG